MKLSQFLSKMNYTLSEFADEVDCSISMLSHINTGRRRPSPDLALRIERMTGSLVTRDEMLFPEIYDHLENLESQIKPEYDRVLSRKIDNATLIIEG
jgi:transcriptional regulator with XRE-family HTH domain